METTKVEGGELMIGNWVNYKGEPIPVTMIGLYGIQSDYNDKLINAKFVTPDITGIGITTELLGKYGRKYKFGDVIQDDTFEFGNPTKLTVQIYDNTQMRVWYSSAAAYIGIIHLQYLHELQNLFFALTNEPIKIELCL